MKRVLVTLVTLLLMLSPAVPWLVPARAQDDENPADYPRAVSDADAVRDGAKLIGDGKGWYIVTLNDPNLDPGVVADEFAKSDGLVISHVYRYALRGFSARIPDEALRKLKQSGVVNRIEPVTIGTTTAQTTSTGALRVEVAPKAKNAQADINENGGAINVDVAVVDSGIASHTDLNYAGGIDCIDSANPSPNTDSVGHGTMVAGIIGAKDNTSAVVGVAPGARLWSVKVVTPSNTVPTSELLCGINYLSQNKSVLEVANFSLRMANSATSVDDGQCGGSGANGDYDTVHAAVCAVVATDTTSNPNVSGVTVVAAAGNDCINAERVAPAAFDEVITVSAMVDSDGWAGGYGGAFSIPSACNPNSVPFADDTFAAFSNFGADIDLAAPGVGVLTTSANNNGTTGLSEWGTSFAAPHVAGAAALYRAANKNPNATPTQVRSALVAEREQIALQYDPDGIDEGVLNLNDGAAWPDSTVPTISGPTITESENDEHVSGTTVWYNNGNGHQGTFTVGVTASDAESGIDYVAFPTMFGGSGGNDSNSPYQKNYSWTDTDNASGVKTIVAYNPYGYWASTTFTVQPDHTDPTAAITAPTASQTVSGTETVSVTATDNSGGAGIREVKVRVCNASSACGGSQGTVIGTDASAPYDLSWDTTGWADGNYKLVARAFDNVDNQVDSASVTVTVSNGSSLMGSSTGDESAADAAPAAADDAVGQDGTVANDDDTSDTAKGNGRGHCAKDKKRDGHGSPAREPKDHGKHDGNAKHGAKGKHDGKPKASCKTGKS